MIFAWWGLWSWAPCCHNAKMTSVTFFAFSAVGWGYMSVENSALFSFGGNRKACMYGHGGHCSCGRGFANP